MYKIENWKTFGVAIRFLMCYDEVVRESMAPSDAKKIITYSDSYILFGNPSFVTYILSLTAHLPLS